MKEQLTPEQQIARAAEVEQIFSAPVFKEACNRIDAELRMMRESAGLKDSDMHTRLIIAEQMWGKLLDHLRNIMMSGDYARERLRLRENTAERIAQAVRRGIRI